MTDRPTLRLTPADRDIARAATLLAEGKQVAFPTETVYGLGGDAREDTAVAGIFAAKVRPSFNPLIVHVAGLESAARYGRLTDEAAALAQAFWPGALTLVLPLADGHGLSPLVTAGLPSVGLRVPAHPTAQRLLAAFDGPVAAPSANPSGRISPTSAAHVLAGLDGRIAAVIDDGACPVGVESTVLGWDGQTPVLLRPGGVPAEALEAALRRPLVRWQEGGHISSPGQLQSHYAPKAALRLNAQTAQSGELYLGFGANDGDLNLSPSGDLLEAAARLFAALHSLDQKAAPIAVAPIPEHGLGVAINDRLRRAAAPRSR